MDRPDIGTLLAQLLREIVRREEPLLERAGLRMWDYRILLALGEGEVPTQAELSIATRRDKTRLVADLDRLEKKGLITRTPDPTDRRNRIVATTSAGRRVLRECRTAIRAMETDLLSAVPPAGRSAFEQGLVRLAAAVRHRD